MILRQSVREHVGLVPEMPGIGSYVWRVPQDELEWSAGLLAIYGLDAPPSSEAGFYSQLHPEDRVRVEAETNSFLERVSQYQHEFRIVRPDGKVRHVHDRAVVERGSDGKPLTVRGINVDVTDQRAAHQENSFQTLANNINQLAWMADGSGWIYWYNDRWYEYTGTTLSEMAGWGWRKVHHPDHVDRVVERISRSFKNESDWDDTFPLRARDGTYRWFLSRARAVRGADGAVRYWFGTNTDITERRDAEKRLEDSRRRFQALADSMPQLVWTASPNGDATYYNRRLSAYAAAIDPQKSQFDWRMIVHPDDVDRTGSAWAAAVNQRTEYACDHRLKMADGSFRWHLSRALPLDDEAEGFLWYGTATDIDDLKRAESDRQILVEELGHRVKNTLALVQAIAGQTFRPDSDPAVARASFSSRLQALAGAHDLLLREQWREIGIAEIVTRTLSTVGIGSDRFTATGPDIQLVGRIGVFMSMVLHELATNALKYGALSLDGGRIGIAWQVDQARPGGFRFEWAETGGPAVAPPSREGFGSRLIQQAMAQAIRGDATILYEATGVRCVLAGSGTDG